MENSITKYNICIGDVPLILYTPFDIFWKGEDLQFLTGNTNSPLEIYLQEVNKLPICNETPVYINQDMCVYGTSEEQLRSFHRCNSKEPYLCSTYSKNKVEVFIPKNRAGMVEIKYNIWDYIFLEKILLDAGGLILHCSYTEYQGKGICYTAPSGTGKTTQANHWVKKYGAKIINGDKALLKLEKSEWIVCGYPFHGSAAECENISVPLDTLVILRQGNENTIHELTDVEKIRFLYSEITVNVWDSQYILSVLSLLEQLIKKVRVILFYCTKEYESANILYEYLFGGNK